MSTRALFRVAGAEKRETVPALCGTCGRMWDDGAVSHVTPAPSAMCPFCHGMARPVYVGRIADPFRVEASR